MSAAVQWDADRVAAEARAALRALDLLDARDSLHTFCGMIEIPGAPVDDDADDDGLTYRPVETPRAAHHVLMLDVLQEVERGTIPRAMFFLPPGSAKSTYCSVVFPTWFMGRKARRNVIAATYATPLARKIGRRARSIVKQATYQEIFSLGLSTDTSAAENWTLTNGNEFMGAGILAGITGNRSDLNLIDDPIKGRQEADSETIRQRTADELAESLQTRLKPGGRTVLVMTRWHEDDPAGRLLPVAYDGGSGWVKCRDGQDWFVLNIPAQAERADDPLGRLPGEFIWPEWFPASHWAQFMGAPRTWSALFQQRPAPAAGTYFLREWFEATLEGAPLRWNGDPATLPRGAALRPGATRPLLLHVYMTSDHAPAGQEDSDFQVLRVWGIDARGDIWLLDGFRGQVTMDVLAEAARLLILKWKPLCWFPEDDNNWKASEPFIRRYLQQPRDASGQPLKPAHCRIEPISPHGADKAVKAQPSQALAHSRKVHLPSTPEGELILDQLLKFPAGKHDDEVDAFALIGRALDMAHPAIAPREQLELGRPNDRYARLRDERDTADYDGDWMTN